VSDPNEWDIGKPDRVTEGVKPPFPAGKVSLIDLLTKRDTTAGTPRPTIYFRLTACIRGDLGAYADSSGLPRYLPRAHPSTQRVIARDEFALHYRTATSPFADKDDDGQPINVRVRDDIARARASAQAQYVAKGAARVSGTLTVDRVDRTRRLGDRIKGIAGRDIKFAGNVVGLGMPVQWPRIVGIDLDLVGYHTTYQLEDRRLEPVDPGSETILESGQGTRQPGRIASQPGFTPGPMRQPTTLGRAPSKSSSRLIQGI
jgi:hypothetical protein